MSGYGPGVGIRSSTWIIGDEQEEAVFCTPGIHLRPGELVGVVTVVGGRKQVMVNVHLRVHDGTQTHDPWMKRTKTQP